MFKSTVLLAVFAGLFSAQGALAAGLVIEHADDKPSVVGSAKIFTGKVRQDPIASADQYSHNGITVVTFEPGARTFWHSHPAGQRLLIVSGKGFVGTADGVTLCEPATMSGVLPKLNTGTAQHPILLCRTSP